MTASPQGDEGTTLLELLIALAILGIAVVVVVGGMFTTVLTTDVHRKLTTAETLARNYAEAAKAHFGSSTYWARCPTSPVPATAAAPDFTTPTGYTAADATVAFWNAATDTWPTTCPSGTDDTIQRWTFSVTSNDNRSQQTVQIVVRKP